jgi:type VII secretion protein EccB
MTVVSAGSLAGVPQGEPVGIVGAPDAQPAAGAVNKGPWLVCALPGSQVSVSIGIAPAVRPLPAGSAVVVSASGARYLVWHGQRLRLDASWILDALGLGQAPVIGVSPVWLNAVPAGPDLTPLRVPGRGGQGPTLGQLRTRVGEVLVSRNVGSPSEFYLAEPGGVAPITPAQAAVALTDPASAAAYPGAAVAPVTASPAAIAHAPVVQPGLADAADAPSAPPKDDSGGSGVPCMDYAGAGGAAPRLVFASAPGGQPPAMGQPGVSGSPQTADLISVVPDGGAFIRPQAAPGVGGDSLFLVTDAGVKFPVPSASAASALGYRLGRAAALPAALLGLLPTGPALDLAPMRG